MYNLKLNLVDICRNRYQLIYTIYVKLFVLTLTMKLRFFTQESPDDFSKYYEFFAIIWIVLIWIYAVIVFRSAPPLVPVHINTKGSIDSYGTKENLFILPVLSIIIYVLLTFVSKLPSQAFNYLEEVTAANRDRLHHRAKLTIKLLKIIVSALIFIVYVLMYTRIIFS